MLETYIDKIIEGEAVDLMRNIPDNSIDVSFVDPPFNLKKQYSTYKDSKNDNEYLDWSKKWILEMIRVTKPSGSIFIHNIPKWLLEYYRIIMNEKDNATDDNPYKKHLENIRLIDWIVWNEIGVPKGRYLYASHYGILWLSKSSKTKFYNLRIPHEFCRSCKALIKDYGGKKSQINEFGPILSDVWSDIHRYKHSKRRANHPNQLPVPLLERILLMSADVGDIVLDPMVGVGTTCIAAKRLGMHYIGIDIDENYCKIARENIAKTNEIKINEAHVSIFLNKIVTVRNKDIQKIVESTLQTPIKVNGKGEIKKISTGILLNKDLTEENQKLIYKF